MTHMLIQKVNKSNSIYILTVISIHISPIKGAWSNFSTFFQTSGAFGITREGSKTVVASRGHGRASCPPLGGFAPSLDPPLGSQKKKMVKISHFRQIFGFLPPQKCIFVPSMFPTPTKKKKKLVPPLLIQYFS